MLDLATVERGQLRLQARPIELAGLVAEAAGAIEAPPGWVVQLEVGADVRASVDPARIPQVLRNLVENGMRHGAGDVTVSAERTAAAVRLLVSDTGTGVAPEHDADLFVPFAHWSGRSDSTGLGLAIARRIAEAHGGSLDYRPRSDGSPHAFVLELPAAGV
jgi:two-component system, OmpR family, sensor histidine kinase BaeS